MKLKAFFSALACAAFIGSSVAQTSPLRQLGTPSQGIKPVTTTRPSNPEATRNKTAAPLVAGLQGLQFVKIYDRLQSDTVQNLLKVVSSSEKLARAGITEEKLKTIAAGMMPDEGTIAKPVKDPNYVTLMLEQAKKHAGVDAKIVKIEWSRDPVETAKYVNLVKNDLLKLYEAAVKENRPLHILSDSWGNIIMFAALNSLAKEGRTFYADKWISLGAPLMPAGLIRQAADKPEEVMQAVNNKIKKPAVVGKWINFYAYYDGYSGIIESADKNIQIDKDVAPYVKKVEAAAPSKDKELDLEELTSGVTWHDAMYLNVNVKLRTVNATYKKDLIKKYAAEFF